MSEQRTVTREQCPRCAHRPHQPHGCEARYHVTFEAGEAGDPCLCSEAVIPPPADPSVRTSEEAIGWARPGPYGEIEASKWVEEFDRIFPDHKPDSDTMFDWFANAIMTGYDIGRAVAQRKPQP